MKNPELMLTSDANDRIHHDFYHCLADEFHEGVGRLLDQVLKEKDLPLATRQDIVESFLFRLMDALDGENLFTLSEKFFSYYPELKETYPEARKTWQPALVFLQRDADPENGHCKSGDVNKALICLEPWLHETSGEWQQAYFEGQK